MKKISLAVSLLSISLLIVPAIVGAQGGVGGVRPITTKAEVDLTFIINTILDWAFGLLLVLAALFILWAAFVYLTGGGSESSQADAKKLIIFAVVAIIVGFLARGLVLIVRQLLGVGT